MLKAEKSPAGYYEKCAFLREARRNALMETADICRRVLNVARHVKINSDAIKKFIEANYEREFVCPSWKEEFNFPQDDKEFVEFLGASTAVNFAFTNFEAPYGKYCVQFPEEKLHYGASAMGAALMRARSEGRPIFNFKYLAKIRPEEVSWIFRCHGENTQIPLLGRRLTQMRSFGQTMLLLGYKDMTDFISAHDFFAFSYSLNGIVYPGFVDRLCSCFSSFYDTVKYKNTLIVPFNKRANLLALMYQQRAEQPGSSLEQIRDAKYIVPPADYQVPRALQCMGLIEYSDALKNKLKERKILSYGGVMEMEMRAVVIVVMQMLLAGINRQRDACNPPKKEITLCELDAFMWFAGRSASSDLPHHLTKTTAY